MQMSDPAQSASQHTREEVRNRVIERSEPLKTSLISRLTAAGLALGSLSVLSIGAWLDPSTDGHGTHTQLGLSPCMWAATMDKPCMTCGMTTSFAHAGEGQWIQSFLTQPMGMFLVVLTSVVFWGASAQAATGARIGTMIQPALRPRVFIMLGVMMLLAWGYKIITW